ncbi:MAG: molybdopterin-dependent oxidoreductase [Acidimicrobiales bacterium]
MTGSRPGVVGSCPLDCPDACSWVVTVDGDGAATRLRGNPDHPFTRGGLCKKVNTWLDHAADPGRLLSPRRRVGAKGEGRFVDITWEEALAEMAERFTAVIDRWGPAAIWPFAGTGNVGYLQGGAGPAGARLWHHLGTSRHELTICSVSGHAGLAYTLGTSASLDPEEMADAGVILLWGTNTLVANQHLWPVVAAARAKGAPVVVVDPMRTRTAARADVHLALRPGTDGALALGLARAMVDGGGADRGFLERRTVGWEAFAASLDEWTPERTAEVCGLEGAEITAVARLLVEHSPLAVKLGQGMQRHANGGQAARTVSILPAITGDYDRPGGGLVYSTGSHYGLNLDPATAVAPANPSAPPRRRLAMTRLGTHLCELDDPPVGALVVYGANPVVSNPDTGSVRRGLSRPDLFTVVIDLFATETTAYADLVLPSTMQHEHHELNDSYSHLYLNWNEPAVAPPGRCLPHTEIFRRLAAALGLDEPALHDDDLALAAALLDTKPYRDAGITVDTLRAAGWVRVPGTAVPFRPVAARFPTPSGRFELASESAETDDFGLLPTYRPPAEAAVDDGRLALVAAAGEWHVNSTFAATEVTAGRSARPAVVIGPGDARRLGLVDGDRVEVANERGSFRAELAVDDAVRPGVAHTVKGWWAMDVNATVVERDADMAWGAVFHDNLVTIRRA